MSIFNLVYDEYTTTPVETNPELCLIANVAGSTVALNKNGSPTNVTLETSTNGINWSTYTF